MKWDHWKSFYLQILSKMGYDMEKDREAALLLRELLLENENYILTENIKERIGERVYVFGAGPSLEKKLERREFGGTLISSDGATSALLENGIVPHIIVTDLDGNFEESGASHI